jgi:hypothetical protein
VGRRNEYHPGGPHEPAIFFARISGTGVDFVEHPTDFARSGIPSDLIRVVSAGTVNIVGRDQQVAHGSIAGNFAQGEAEIHLTPLPYFPIERLRDLLANNPAALEAAEEIHRETNSPKPRFAAIVAAAETIRGAAAIAEVSRIVTSWLQEPSVSKFLQHGIQQFVT